MGILASICKGILDIVYPPKCLVCSALQPNHLCEDCSEKIDLLGPICCERCGSPLESEVCWECRGKRFSFDSARCYGYYTGVLREAIHQFKYQGHRQLAADLGLLLSAAWIERPDAPAVDVVVPVPIHQSRERERGFNQSFLLGEVVADKLALPLVRRALLRRRATQPQARLALEYRAENVKDAFAQGRDVIAGQNIILIDDVFTTGSTLDDAARALKAAGAASVHALVLARSI